MADKLLGVFGSFPEWWEGVDSHKITGEIVDTNDFARQQSFNCHVLKRGNIYIWRNPA